MRINFYEARLSEDDRIILVKDKAVNYKAEKLNAPDKIAKMMRELLHMGKMAEEYCYMIALSSACRILGSLFISKGTVNAKHNIKTLLSFAVNSQDYKNLYPTTFCPVPPFCTPFFHNNM